MGKLFDQRFTVYFELWGYMQSDRADYTSPAHFRFIRLDKYYYLNTYYRSVDVFNVFNSAQLPNGWSCGEPCAYAAAPFVWHPETTYTDTLDFSVFRLHFGNLNLSLNDELIALINDADKPKFSRSWSVGDQLTTMTTFNNFDTGRKIIRKTYNINNTLTKTKQSRLLITDAALEIPLEMELTVARETRGNNNIRVKMVPVQNIFEIHSTGEESTRWS